MRHKMKIKLTTTQAILLSFLVVILIGSILLVLPICSKGEQISYIDALFTATTSVCVTGLVTLPTVHAWSILGQIVILLLIQIGGLGVITIISGVMISLHQKMGLRERILIQDAFNLNTLSGLVRFVKKVLVGTFLIEGIGALFYMIVFVPEFGAKGVWISIFNSVSAFCNAGIDIIGENSLCDYVFNPIINGVTCGLIILGGIGYIVWWDVVNAFKRIRRQGLKCFKYMTLHSKLAISVSAVLIVVGAILFFACEYNNPLTMKEYSLFNKIQASFFQSITTRTAGFATIPQQNLSNGSSFVTLLLMFIGGSPVGTAGGVKTVTIAVLIASAFSTIRNRDDVLLFNRTVSKQAVHKSVAVVTIAFIIVFISTVLLSVVTDAGALDLMFETISATATVGLSRNLTGSLNVLGKLIIIITMYLGRVGPISFAILLNNQKENVAKIKNPTEDISVG